MNIAICDDDDFFRSEVTEAVKEYIQNSNNKAVHVDSFRDAEDCLETSAKKGGYDIYILDVMMPLTDGIQLGESLRAKGCDGKIIYLTSSEEFAVKSYKVRAFDYLLKPVNKTKLFACLDEATRDITEKSGKSLMVKTKESTVKLNFDSIMYAELSRRAVVYHLSSGRTVESLQLRTTFADATKELMSDKRFFSCGAGMLVNLSAIIEVSTDHAVCKGGEKLMLGRKAVRELRSAWCDFCLEEVKSL